MCPKHFQEGDLLRVEGLALSVFVLLLPTHFFKFARELEANALEEAALGSDTDSFVFPVISKNRPAVPFIWL